MNLQIFTFPPQEYINIPVSHWTTFLQGIQLVFQLVFQIFNNWNRVVSQILRLKFKLISEVFLYLSFPLNTQLFPRKQKEYLWSGTSMNPEVSWKQREFCNEISPEACRDLISNQCHSLDQSNLSCSETVMHFNFYLFLFFLQQVAKFKYEYC